MTDKIRNAFEAFAKTHSSLKQYGFARYPDDGDDYDAIPLQDAWSAWQASRAAVVIELPPEESGADKTYDGNYVVGCQQGWNEMRDKAIVAIEAAGIAVKS